MRLPHVLCSSHARCSASTKASAHARGGHQPTWSVKRHAALKGACIAQHHGGGFEHAPPTRTSGRRSCGVADPTSVPSASARAAPSIRPIRLRVRGWNCATNEGGGPLALLLLLRGGGGGGGIARRTRFASEKRIVSAHPASAPAGSHRKLDRADRDDRVEARPECNGCEMSAWRTSPPCSPSTLSISIGVHADDAADATRGERRIRAEPQPSRHERR